MFKTLATYRAHEIILSLPVYKEQSGTAEALSQTLLDHDRAVKTSCELGLHLRRANRRCKPFEVLLNLEETEAQDHLEFDYLRNAPIMPPLGLI